MSAVGKLEIAYHVWMVVEHPSTVASQKAHDSILRDGLLHWSLGKGWKSFTVTTGTLRYDSSEKSLMGARWKNQNCP